MTPAELHTIIQAYRPKRKHIIAIALIAGFLIFAPENWLLFLLRSPHPYLAPWIGLVFIGLTAFLILDLFLHIKQQLSAWWTRIQDRLPDGNIFKVKK